VAGIEPGADGKDRPRPERRRQPGQMTKTIAIVLNGDKKDEPDEMFYLDVFRKRGNSLFAK
jgi:hypothetical protein